MDLEEMTSEEIAERNEYIFDSLKEDEDFIRAWSNDAMLKVAFGENIEPQETEQEKNDRQWADVLADEKPVVCRICGRKLTDLIDIEFYNDCGMCLGCDHVKSDVEADRRAEAESMNPDDRAGFER
jgi:hypothetical protein